MSTTLATSPLTTTPAVSAVSVVTQPLATGDVTTRLLGLAWPEIEALAPTFTTRDEYLAWRATWRATYAAYVRCIRAQRALLRSSTSDEIPHRYAQSYKATLRAQARRLLEIRAASKALAEAQWTAGRGQARGPAREQAAVPAGVVVR